MDERKDGDRSRPMCKNDNEQCILTTNRIRVKQIKLDIILKSINGLTLPLISLAERRLTSRLVLLKTCFGSWKRLEICVKMLSINYFVNNVIDFLPTVSSKGNARMNVPMKRPEGTNVIHVAN